MPREAYESDSTSPAGAMLRFRAFALDGLLVAGYAAALAGGAAVVTRLAPGTVEGLFSTRWTGQAVGLGAMTLPVVVALGLADAGGAGFGKRRMGLRVERSGGGPPGPVRSIVRTAFKLLPWELAHTALWEFRFEGAGGIGALVACYAIAGVYLATVALEKEHRAPYDLLLRTRVVEAD